MNKVHKLHAAMDDCGDWAADHADLRIQTAERGHALGYCASTCEWGCVQGHRRCNQQPAEACTELGAEPGHDRPRGAFYAASLFVVRTRVALAASVVTLSVMALLLWLAK